MKKNIVWIWVRQVLIVTAVGCGFLSFRFVNRDTPDAGVKAAIEGIDIELKAHLKPIGGRFETYVGEYGNEHEENLLIIHTSPPGARVTIRTATGHWYLGLSPAGVINVSAFAFFTRRNLIITVADGAKDTDTMWPLGRFGLLESGDRVQMYDLAISALAWEREVTGDFVVSRVYDMLILRFPDTVRVFDVFSGQLVWDGAAENGAPYITSISSPR